MRALLGHLPSLTQNASIPLILTSSEKTAERKNPSACQSLHAARALVHEALSTVTRALSLLRIEPGLFLA